MHKVSQNMTSKDELLALALLFTLAAMLYLAVWFIEGKPFSQEEPATIVSYFEQAQVLNHRSD
jgi:hypothetical protein